MKSRWTERPELIVRSQSAGSTFNKSSPLQSKGKDKAVDFSDLFGFGDSESSKLSDPTPKTSGMARRMLGRTQSGPSSRGGPSGSNGQGPIGLKPLLPGKADTVIDLTEEAPSTTPPVKVVKSAPPENPPPHTNGRTTNLRTYGGPSRSFLIELPANQVPSLTNSQLTEDSIASLLQSQEDEFGGHESYTSLRSRWGVDNSEDDPYQPLAAGPSTWLTKKKGKSGRPPIPLSNSNNSELRSITELRNTGENRRFNDEVGYLFEGLTVESELSVKRGRYAHHSFYQSDTDEPIQCCGASEQDGGLAVFSPGAVCGLCDARVGGTASG